MKPPHVYVIILSYHGSLWLKNCLQSLLESTYTDYKILVIDNASHDDSVDIIRNDFPSVELLINDRNLGFAGGMNQGLRYAYARGAKYFFLLNQDTMVDPRCLQELVETANDNFQLGLLAPVQFAYGSRKLHEVFRRWLVLNLGVTEVTALQGLGKNFITVTEVLGAAMLLSRRALEAVGGFDSFYFACFEETDLCRRLRYHGFVNALCPQAVVWHDEDISDSAKEFFFLRSQTIFWLKDPFRGAISRWLWAAFSSLRNLLRIIYRKDVQLLKKYLVSQREILLNIPLINIRRAQEMRPAGERTPFWW